MYGIKPSGSITVGNKTIKFSDDRSGSFRLVRSIRSIILFQNTAPPDSFSYWEEVGLAKNDAELFAFIPQAELEAAVSLDIENVNEQDQDFGRLGFLKKRSGGGTII
jgi:hypothetical protein